MTDEEQIERATRRLQGIRRMRPKEGWNSVYIEIIDGIPYMIFRNGNRMRTILYTAGFCLRALKTGEWIEI